MEEREVCFKGVSFWGLLQIAFIVLKLCGVIGWSWGLVLLPLIIGSGLFILAMIFVIIWFVVDYNK